jgi:hypothetical protein
MRRGRFLSGRCNMERGGMVGWEEIIWSNQSDTTGEGMYLSCETEVTKNVVGENGSGGNKLLQLPLDGARIIFAKI